MTSFHPSPADPWGWSVDQVVREFCRTDEDRPAWCSPTDPLPDSAALERELRENHVTGEIILTEVTKEVLRTELNIRSMGQRHTIEKGINHLRTISQKFDPSQSNQVKVPPFTPLQSWLNTSGPPYDPPSNVGGSVRSGLPFAQPFDSPRLDLHLEASGNLQPYGPNVRGPAQVLAASASCREVPRFGAAHQVSIDRVQPATFNETNPASPCQSQHKPAIKVRRRIAPTFVAHLDDKIRHPAPLSREEGGVASEKESLEAKVDEHEFRILGAQVTDGQRVKASRRMKKYLTLFDKGFSADRQISSGSQVAGFNDAAKIKNPLGADQSQDIQSEFDYLLAKYPPKADTEDVVALYGDSGEEGEYDEETWQEIEKDAAEDQSEERPDRALSLSMVNSAVDDAIQEFRSVWWETRLAKVQAKGFRLWKKANQEGRVDDEIDNAQYWIHHLQQSIVKIRQAITREKWINVAAVRHQCQSLEESVFQQQEHQYNISILRNAKPPPRPNRKSVKRENIKSSDMAVDEIVLQSESDVSTSNFIDDEGLEPIPTAMRAATTNKPAQVHTSDDSDDVVSPQANRRKAKPQILPVDPRKNPFIDSESPSSANAPSSGADSDSDRSVGLPKSRYESVGHEKTKPIEFLSSSDPPTPAKPHASGDTTIGLIDDEVSQPPTPIRRIKLTLKPDPDGLAALDDIERIRETTWGTIEEKDDHRRALAKAVYSLPAGKAKKVQELVKICPEQTLLRVLEEAFSAILDRHAKVEGIEENDWDTARLTTLLFASYSLAKRVVDERHLDKERTLKKAQGLVQFGGSPFLKALKRILSNYPRVAKNVKRKLSDAGSQEQEVRTSDSDSAVPQHTPGKKKRRHVKQSQTAISSQLAGQLRLQEMEQRIASMDQKFQDIPRTMKDPVSYAIGVEEPVICLDPKISGKVKPHQINGIRFMWRELMTDENKQGCLLAHTMGLGKTMQVISLLVTIAQSVNSPDPAIRKQIPLDLRDLKALILCPPSLIDNWYEEILMWRPDQHVLGGLFKITQRSRRPDRVQDIGQWASTGGILIISYDMFRGLIVNKTQAGRNADERPLSDTDHTVVQEHLLDHPNIIIADEAHKMKNTEAGISMVTSRFRSSRRIALTGSPLANNLDEYFAMIDWIAPGYLGTKEQFRSKYANPISDGLWNDSDTFDRRISLRKLHVLKKNLDPKISRADITAIADDLPSKTEFFITVPLTKMQIKAYNLYITSLLGGDATKTTGNAKLWDWLAILSLLCNHPSTFLNKLDDRQYGHKNRIRKAKTKTITTTDDVEGPGLPTDIEFANAGLSPELIKQQRKIFRAVEDAGRLEDPSLSHRSQVVCDIIELAVAAGDKVLLFSHSIPTLNYLEEAISSLGHSTCRLDGKTNVTKRQEAVKDFNKETATYNVFFISTRAGGLGLNLQGANRVILFDYGFNPIWEEQAIGRAYRLGQRKAVFVYRLRAGGTFEELIYNKAVFKTQLSARVVDKKNPMRYASRKATDYLFPVKEVAQQDLNPFCGKDPLVLDAVLSMCKYIRNITLTETFQKEEDESLTPEEVKQANDELKDEQDKRRDPAGYEKKRAEHQAAVVNARLPLPVPTARRSSPYTINFALRPSMPGFQPTQPFSMPPDTPAQQIHYISRPEAVFSPQQSESAFWDHRVPPHLQNRVENVLGVHPPFRNTFQSTYPSPTAEALPPKASKKTPGSPPQIGKQLDGAGNDEDCDPGLPECQTQ
jgi:SNF2 family DNA or RNA helicase